MSSTSPLFPPTFISVPSSSSSASGSPSPPPRTVNPHVSNSTYSRRVSRSNLTIGKTEQEQQQQEDEEVPSFDTDNNFFTKNFDLDMDRRIQQFSDSFFFSSSSSSPSSAGYGGGGGQGHVQGQGGQGHVQGQGQHGQHGHRQHNNHHQGGGGAGGAGGGGNQHVGPRRVSTVSVAGSPLRAHGGRMPSLHASPSSSSAAAASILMTPSQSTSSSYGTTTGASKTKKSSKNNVSSSPKKSNKNNSSSSSSSNNNRETDNLLPVTFCPGENDVICQRGKDCHEHVGNRRFRRLVEQHLDSYLEAGGIRQDKTNVITGIVQQLQSTSTSGKSGFVMKVRFFTFLGARGGKQSYPCGGTATHYTLTRPQLLSRSSSL